MQGKNSLSIEGSFNNTLVNVYVDLLVFTRMGRKESNQTNVLQLLKHVIKYCEKVYE